VRQVESQKEKYERLTKIVKEWKTGIVYCATRKRVEEVAQRLNELGLSVTAYHGGMDDRARERAQNEFLSRSSDIVVATNAFGMGIDRSDVRFVVHFEVPGSVEAYYQEAGRAGDREAAVCELLFNFADTSTQEFFIDGDDPDPILIRNIYSALLSHADDNHVVLSSIQDLADWAGARNTMAVGSAISTLTRARYLERFDVPGQRIRGTKLLQPNVSAFEVDLDEAALLAKSRSRPCQAGGSHPLSATMIVAVSNGFSAISASLPRRFAGIATCALRIRPPQNAPLPKRKALMVRKALAGVARMSRKGPHGWEGRFGKGKIIQMLIGSRSNEIVDKGLHELTTHGILKETGQPYLYALFKELEQAALIRTEAREFRLITLTNRGAEVMKGATGYQLAWPTVAATAKSRPVAGKGSSAPAVELKELGFDPVLFEKLKAKRAEIAAADGGKPAYTVFANQTLELLTRLQPTSMETGMSIRGVGPAKAERYLAQFIEVIQAHQSGKFTSRPELASRRMRDHSRSGGGGPEAPLHQDHG